MLNYRDKTFCPFWETCNHGDNCSRKANKQLVQRAKNFGLPLCLFMDKPNCYTEKFKSVKDGEHVNLAITN